MKKMKDIWFKQASGDTTGGVILSQHTDNDSNFPGWQKGFGEGTFLGNTDFDNDDASHISIDEGYTATLREHGPSDDRYPGKEYTYTGPTSLNLTDIDFNDELSEMTISAEPLTPFTPEPLTPFTPDPLTPFTPVIDEVDDTTTPSLETSSLVAEDSNMVMYVAIGAVVLVAGYLLITRKPAKR